MLPFAALPRLVLPLAAVLLALAPRVSAQSLDARASDPRVSDARVFDPQTGEPVPFGFEAPPADAPPAEARGGGSDLTLRQYLPSGSTKLVRDISETAGSGGLSAFIYQDGGSLVSVVPFSLADPDPCPCFSEPFVLEAQPADAVIEGDLAYVALRKSKGLLILDISDSSEIEEVGRIEGRDLLAIAVDGDYAYAGRGTSGIVVYDVSDPANPTEIVTQSVPGSSNGAFVADTTLYVATGVDGLRTFSLEDPTAPVALGHFDTGGEFATYVVVRDTVAWLTGNFGLIAVDISDPASPTEIGRFGTDGETTYEVAFHRDFGSLTAYLPGLDGLRTLDVSNPAAITQEDIFPANQAFSVALYATMSFGPVVYFAERFKGLHVLFAEDAPEEILFVENAGFSHKPFFDGDLLYVTDLAGRLRIINTGESQAREIARIDVPPNTQEVVVKDGLAYVTDADFGGTGLTIVDVSDPTDPQIVGSYGSGNQAFGLDVVTDGDAVTVYLANGFSGLVALDASDPANVEELSSFPIGANVVDVEVQEDFEFGLVAYVVSFGGGMLTLDVSDPANPVQLDAEPGYGFLNAIDVYEDFINGPIAYVADGQQGLRVVNIDDPEDLVTISTSPTASQARDVAATSMFEIDISFGLAYVADDFFGLREFTQGAGEIEETGSFESTDRGIGVATSRNTIKPDSGLVALAAGETGVYLFELPPNIILAAEGESTLSFALDNAFPNPFASAATVRFTLSESAEVTLAVYDVLGRRVAELADGPQAAGQHEAVFDAAGLPSGVYLVRLTAGAHRATRRLVLVR